MPVPKTPDCKIYVAPHEFAEIMHFRDACEMLRFDSVSFNDVEFMRMVGGLPGIGQHTVNRLVSHHALIIVVQEWRWPGAAENAEPPQRVSLDPRWRDRIEWLTGETSPTE